MGAEVKGVKGAMRCRFLAAVAVVFAAASVGGAVAGVTTTDTSGTVVADGSKVFPLVLAKGPDAGRTAPDGTDAFAEVASAGATMLKIGPATTAWTSADISDAELQNRAAAAHGLSTWVNLSTVSQAARDALLAQVVSSLKTDPGSSAIGMWKGQDEPFWSKVAPAALQFAYCRTTGRGETAWCGGEPVLDSDHAWVTVEAPRYTAELLAPYSAVTDMHGVDVYPVTLADPAPDLHEVGRWTNTVASITPNHAVWTTLQICASGSYDSASGTYVLPTFAQERYMAYDAIINGARSLAFYGGNIQGCWNAADRTSGWNWTFWSSVLKPLIGELNSMSPLAPALVHTATTQAVTTDDPSTQAISRAGAGQDLWIIAARGGSGSATVRVSGLPAGISSGTVYTERDRSIQVVNGAFTDEFPQWAVHVYRFVPDPSPAVSSFTPASGAPGTAVTILGANLTGATAVEFGAISASYTVVSAGEIDTTVPSGATTAAIGVTTPGGRASSSTPFVVPAEPPPSGGGGGGGGGGSSVPDLSVELVPRATASGPGDANEIIAYIKNSGGAGSLQTHLNVQLPPEIALLGSPSFERGSGCTGTSAIDCFLDYIPNGETTRVILEVRATAAGVQTISATASSDRDSDPSNNTATLTLQVGSPASSPPSPTRTPSHGKTLTGNALANHLTATAFADILNGLGGKDILDGLGGNDILNGGKGNDILNGGPGKDVLNGGPGNDTVRAQDGQRDTIDCGAGRDIVYVDRADRVAKSCEQVHRR